MPGGKLLIDRPVGSEYMAESFPSFDGLRVEQSSPTAVYAYFREIGRENDIYASGVSDGYLQQLLLLTALFSEGEEREAVLLFDEPEISLHPWPLAVFSKAVIEASEHWNKQVILATHSPVLLSQFDVEHICATAGAQRRWAIRSRTNSVSQTAASIR